jgi:hypothetical protein
LLVSGSPVKGRRDGSRAGGGADKRASNEFRRRVGGINGSEEVNIDEVVNEVRAKVERAACSERGGEVRRGGGRRKSGDECRRSTVAAE